MSEENVCLEKEIRDAVAFYENGCSMKDGFRKYRMEEAVAYLAKELWGGDWIEARGEE